MTATIKAWGALSKQYSLFSDGDNVLVQYMLDRPILDWCRRGGFSNVEDIEPIHVAAYIESRQGSVATIKQHPDGGHVLLDRRRRGLAL
jgi:hypothetical protein